MTVSSPVKVTSSPALNTLARWPSMCVETPRRSIMRRIAPLSSAQPVRPGEMEELFGPTPDEMQVTW